MRLLRYWHTAIQDIRNRMEVEVEGKVGVDIWAPLRKRHVIIQYIELEMEVEGKVGSRRQGRSGYMGTFEKGMPPFGTLKCTCVISRPVVKNRGTKFWCVF